jgi:hypothetical protein
MMDGLVLRDTLPDSRSSSAALFFFFFGSPGSEDTTAFHGTVAWSLEFIKAQALLAAALFFHTGISWSSSCDVACLPVSFSVGCLVGNGMVYVRAGLSNITGIWPSYTLENIKEKFTRF